MNSGLDSKTPSEYIKEISDLYFVYRRIIDEKKYKDDKEFYIYSSFIQKVNRAYEKLDGVERQIINNDFFYEDYRYWWRKIYTESTYYRLKSRTMKKFIIYYEEN